MPLFHKICASIALVAFISALPLVILAGGHAGATAIGTVFAALGSMLFYEIWTT